MPASTAPSSGLSRRNHSPCHWYPGTRRRSILIRVPDTDLRTMISPLTLDMRTQWLSAKAGFCRRVRAAGRSTRADC